MHSPDNDGYASSVYNLFVSFGNTLVLSLVFAMIAFSSPAFISSMSGLAAWIVTGSAMRHTTVGGAADAAGVRGRRLDEAAAAVRVGRAAPLVRLEQSHTR